MDRSLKTQVAVPPRRFFWSRSPEWVAAFFAMLCAASIRYEVSEYRDGAGDVTAIHSRVLLPWQRQPSIAGDRAGTVTRKGWLAFGLIHTARNETVAVRHLDP